MLTCGSIQGRRQSQQQVHVPVVCVQSTFHPMFAAIASWVLACCGCQVDGDLHMQANKHASMLEVTVAVATLSQGAMGALHLSQATRS